MPNLQEMLLTIKPLAVSQMIVQPWFPRSLHLLCARECTFCQKAAHPNTRRCSHYHYVAAPFLRPLLPWAAQRGAGGNVEPRYMRRGTSRSLTGALDLSASLTAVPGAGFNGAQILRSLTSRHVSTSKIGSISAQITTNVCAARRFTRPT